MELANWELLLHTTQPFMYKPCLTTHMELAGYLLLPHASQLQIYEISFIAHVELADSLQLPIAGQSHMHKSCYAIHGGLANHLWLLHTSQPHTTYKPCLTTHVVSTSPTSISPVWLHIWGWPAAHCCHWSQFCKPAGPVVHIIG